VPKWQAMQLCAALGFSRLSLLFGLHDIPLASEREASTELITRQVGV